MTIIEYCTEEVRRQGHDVLVSKGIKRVGWLLEAWSFAMFLHSESPKLRLGQVIEFGRMVEHAKNKQGVRTCGVRVGATIMPPYERVPVLLEWLMRQELAPLDFLPRLSRDTPVRGRQRPRRQDSAELEERYAAREPSLSTQ